VDIVKPVSWQASIEAGPEKVVTHGPFTKISDVSIESLRVEPLKTGFHTLDEHYVLKARRPELVVVGAGTSHGKSAFMVQVASHVAQGGPVFVFSLEMDERDIKARLLAPRAQIPLQDIVAGKAQGQRLRDAALGLNNLQLYLCCNGRRDVHYITQTAYDEARTLGAPHLVVVDYLQLVKGPNKPTRTAEIAEILGVLKEMAKTLKCPVLIGSQLNRNCERRGKEIEMDKGLADYTPMKSDLMDSGSIEHDADVIMFISPPVCL
jgi:replicative DNA helicase